MYVLIQTVGIHQDIINEIHYKPVEHVIEYLIDERL